MKIGWHGISSEINGGVSKMKKRKEMAMAA
jgi:hypothetical protein